MLAARRVGPSNEPSLIREVLATPGSPLDPGLRTDKEQRLGHDFGAVRVHTDARAAASADAVAFSGHTMGSHLVLGRVSSGGQLWPAMSHPAGPDEREADRVAQAVLAIGAVRPSSVPAVREAPRAAPQPTGGAVALPSVVPAGGGRPLPTAVRSYFEPRFGADFSRVRIHADHSANRSAGSIDALAYTLGSDIVLRSDLYAPDTSTGRRLLAHELTHVVQQGGAKGLDRSTPQVGFPQTARQHEADQGDDLVPAWQRRVAGRGTLEPIVQRAPDDATPTGTGPSTVPSGPTTSTAGPAASPSPGGCDATALTEIRGEALDWLTDVVAQLIDARVDQAVIEVFGGTPKPETVRVMDALDRTFRTRDLDYSEIVLRRLQLVESNLRANNVKLLCSGTGDPHCSVTHGGTGFVAAYVQRAMELVMCSAGAPGSRPVATFIHELCHAVMPNVGTKHPATGTDVNVTDRAYPSERLFARLTSEEALDNAASYEAFVAELRTRKVARSAAPGDTAKSCTDPGPVLDAIARAESWNRDTTRWLRALLEFLRDRKSTTVLDLPSDQLAHLTKHFVTVSSTSDLQSLLDFYGQMAYAFGVGQDVQCGGKSCAGDVRGFAEEGTVSLTSFSLKKTRATGITLCPNWATDGDSDRVRTMFALFIVSRPSWMTKGIKLADVFAYVDLVAEMAPEVTPPPKARSLADHWIADLSMPSP